MKTYDILNPNATFEAMMAESVRLSQNMDAKAFGRLMWDSLSDENRRLYLIAFPPMGIGCGYNAATARSEDRILARQERAGLHD